jgi:hypothetical protein
MPMADWLHKYPGVQALLQQDDEALAYAPDQLDVYARQLEFSFVYHTNLGVPVASPGGALACACPDHDRHDRSTSGGRECASV